MSVKKFDESWEEQLQGNFSSVKIIRRLKSHSVEIICRLKRFVVKIMCRLKYCQFLSDVSYVI